MPELAEVEYYRKQWNPGLSQTIEKVHLHSHSRVFRGQTPSDIQRGLQEKSLQKSFAHGKQMLFQFKSCTWLGVHLGMTGKLFTAKPDFIPQKQSHLVLYTEKNALVFEDFRHFGKISWEESREKPLWWTSLPPSILSQSFTQEKLQAFLKKRKNSPIKAVLLMQEQFPGVGNWMADEINWRSGIHPTTRAGKIPPDKVAVLYGEIKEVCQKALDIVGEDWGDFPDSWLFNHRWREGGICPRSGEILTREKIGGRTTCYSPSVQELF